MTEIKHRISEEELDAILEAEGSRKNMKAALLSIGIAVGEPPRAIVTREEFNKANAEIGFWPGSKAYADVADVVSRLNIRVVP